MSSQKPCNTEPGLTYPEDISGVTPVHDASGAIVMATGFKAGVAYCGLKTDDAGFDICVIVSDTPAVGAALFTKNQIVAAPVRFSRKVVEDGCVNAVVVNSGNANACTGEQGLQDAETMSRLVAEGLGVDPGDVVVASTGIIGHPLQMDKVNRGISSALKNLDSDLVTGANAAKAIMTTDTFIKESAVKVSAGDISFTVGGIAKGAGMIAPDMATMLSFITTDANLSHAVLDTCLRRSVEQSFNRITVDGHTSTNDTVAILANGNGRQCRPLVSGEDIRLFQNALDHITLDLARKIIEDGEGATKFVQIDVVGAGSQDDAVKIAKAIGNSPLVKTAINGEDYNWGRIISAAGYAGVRFDEARVRLFINGMLLFDEGAPVAALASDDVLFHERMRGVMQEKRINIRLDIGGGADVATVWTCDFSHEYVSINADYHT